MNKTEQVIVGMLTENTGSHFLDSGGAYGRHWSRNQARDFAAEPKVRAHFCSYLREGGERALELQAHINLYHWMLENLEFDPAMQARLDAYVEEQPACESWHSIAEGFAEAEQERSCGTCVHVHATHEDDESSPCADCGQNQALPNWTGEYHVPHGAGEQGQTVAAVQ